MRLAIISDVHGNLPNLERTIKLINNQNKVDSFIFLGDILKGLKKDKPIFKINEL